MNFLANVDVLIVDLRENGGGDPKMVAYISSVKARKTEPGSRTRTGVCLRMLKGRDRPFAR